MVFVDFYCSLRVRQVASNGPSGGASDSDGGSEGGGSEPGRKSNVAAVKDATPLPPDAGDLI